MSDISLHIPQYAERIRKFQALGIGAFRAAGCGFVSNKSSRLTPTYRAIAIVALVFCVAVFSSYAGENSDSATWRPVKSSYMVEVGSSRLADTYLTPLHYDGWHIGAHYDRMQALKASPRSWSQQLRLGLDFDRTQNPVRNATMLNLGISASWGALRKFYPMPGLTLAIGPQLGLNIGCLYLNRNGNNPASAKAAVTLDATGLAAYKMKIGRLPVTFSYQPSLACLGIFFSPDYGQLYYQIYLGERSDLTHCAWWGDYFAMDNRLFADLHLGATTLRVGYHGNLLSTKVNNLVTHAFYHAFTLGVTVDWVAVRTGQLNNCISAY